MAVSLSEKKLAASEPQVEGEHFLHDVMLAIRRHRYLIIVTTVLSLAVGIAGLLVLAPSYRAGALILINQRKPQVADLTQILSEQSNGEIAPQIRSEVQTLESEDLCRRVIEGLGLLRVPGFKPGRSHLFSLLDAVRGWLPPEITAMIPAPSIENEMDPNVLMAYAVQAYKDHLTVIADGRSYVISVQFQSADPTLSARIVNEHVELYLKNQVAYKREVGQQVSAWLATEIARLEDRLKASQDAVQKFREENHIVIAGGSTLLNQQLAAVNAELSKAVQMRADTDAKQHQAAELRRTGNIDSDARILDSRTIEGMRQQEAALVRKLGDLTASYGERHPSVIKTQAELADLRQAIMSEVMRITKDVQSQAAIAASREAELRQRLTVLERQSVVADRAEAKLRDLEREVTANRSLLETLLARYKQVGAEEGAQTPDAHVIASATVPVSPSFPKPSTIIPGSIVAGLLLGMVISFARELTARGFRGSQEVEAEFAVPNLGSLPIIPGDWGGHRCPEDCVIDRPLSAYAEAIRHIRIAIQTVPEDINVPRVFLVASSLPNEGKSVLAVSLARSFARAGRRTLLMDCDLRNPSIERLLKLPVAKNDLVDFLGDKASFDDVVRTDTRSTLAVITTRRSDDEPQDWLMSERMKLMLGYSSSIYDVVVIDSPPITAVSDALVLTRYADATILAVRWGRTPREIARSSLHKLFTNGARLCGAVLTQVDIFKGVFSPREPEYYQKLNRVYYSERHRAK